MNRAPKNVFRLIGTVAILTAAFGLWFSATALIGVFFSGRALPDSVGFFAAFSIMTAVCLACYLFLLMAGFQILRLRLEWIRRLGMLLAFEVAWFFTIGLLWFLPGLGESVAEATGIANGGLMAQFLIGFPLWAPAAGFWARKQLQPGPLPLPWPRTIPVRN